jgi:hypothetical protein
VNATAAHTLPVLVLAEQSRQPLSYAPAFEAAVVNSTEGYVAPSVEALLAYADAARTSAAMLFGDRRLMSTLYLGDQPTVTLGELIDFVTDWVIG